MSVDEKTSSFNNQDEMIVEVELSDLSTDNYIELEKIRKDITRQLKDEILVTPKVKLVKGISRKRT